MNEDLELKLTKAKVQSLVNSKVTFLAAIGMGIHTEINDSVATACTDGRSIKWGSSFIKSLSVKQTMFVYLHECYHIVMDHVNQVLDLGLEHDAAMTNIAQDLRNNYDLVELLGDPGIEGIVYDKKYNDKWSWIDIYHDIKDDSKYRQQADNSKPEDSHYDLSKPMQQAELGDVLYKAAEYAKSMGAEGSIPQEVKDLLDKLYKPKLNPARLLRKYFNQRVKSHITFNRTDRRFSPEFIPTKESNNSTNIAIVLDVSGSISEEELTNFYNETMGLVKSKNVKKVTFLQFNHALVRVDEVNTYDKLMGIPIYSGGGTVIDPVFNWIENNKPNITLIFTDGDFRMGNEPKDIIWCVSNNPKFKAKGKVINYVL